MNNYRFRGASIYQRSIELIGYIVEDLNYETKSERKNRVKESCYKLIIHIASALSTHYPNDKLKKLNYALHHFKRVKSYADRSGEMKNREVVEDLLLQTEKLLKVCMKNVWKK